MSHRPRKPNAVDRNRKKKQEAQKQRVADSKRANVRGGESRSSFGVSGAGSNRSALQRFGSPEAQNAVSRPLTQQEANFGANPYVPPPQNGGFDFGQRNPAQNNPGLQGTTQLGVNNIIGGLQPQQPPPDFSPTTVGVNNELLRQPNPQQGSTVTNGIINPTTPTGIRDPSGVPRQPLTINEKTILGAAGVTVGLAFGAPLIAAAITAGEITATTAVAESFTLSRIVPVATTAAKKIATNSKTKKQTASWLSRLASNMRQPRFVAGTLVAVIGSYPFAGFLKEEALQTLGLGVSAAIRNNDLDGADEALDLQREVLNPNLWAQILATIPFVNILDTLKDFYKAATIKMDIDTKVVSDMREKLANGETDGEFYARLAQERKDAKEEERRSDNEYYANISAQQAAAKAANRKADEEYWASILTRRKQDAEEKTQRDAAYWAAYYKARQKARDDNARSKLNFGLL